MTLRARLWLSLALVAAVCGTVSWLLSRPIADVRDRPLAPDDRHFAGVPIEPTLTALSSGDREVRWPVEVIGAKEWLDTADEIDLAVATFLTAPSLRSLSLERGDGRCRFAAAPTAVLTNNAGTPLRRTGPCPSPSAPVTWDLVLRVGAEGRVAFWAYDVRVTDDVPGGLGLTATRTHDRRHLLRGRVRTEASSNTMPRAALLAYAWTGRVATTWLWILLGGISGVLAGGIWALTGSSARQIALGAAGCALAVGGLWAVLVPPLQGADEPDHVLSFAEVVGRNDIEPNLRTLASLTHFERIRFHGDERLRPADVGTPHSVPWTGDVHAERMERRSPLAVLVWRVLHGIIDDGDASAAGLLIRLRLVDAGLFAVAVGVTTLLLAGGGSLWPLLGLAIVPTVPYFGTAFSDWALVTSGAVMLAGALGAIQEERGPQWARGVLLGGALSWLLSASMATLALSPLILASAVARITAGASRSKNPYATAAFWTGVGLGLLPGLIVASDVWAVGYARLDQEDGAGLALLSTVNAGLGAIAHAPWLLLGVPALAALAERLVVRLSRTRHGATVRRMVGRASVGTVIALAALPLMVLAASVVHAWPTLTPMELAPASSIPSYVRATLVTFLTSWRLTGHDQLLFTSFWSGFGWVDTIVPAWLLSLLAAGSAGGFALTCLAARSQPRRAWLIAVHTLGLIGSVAALGVAAAMMERNVHGRYLIVVYVPLLLTAWAGWAHASSGRVAPYTPWIVGGVVALVQGTAIATVLTRYF